MADKRGHPDWGEREYTGGGGGDLEVAARANWPLAYFPDGEIFFHDDFEADNLHWEAYTKELIGEDVALWNTRANSGEQSVGLTCGNGEAGRAVINRKISLPVSDRVALGLFYSHDASARYLQVDFQVENYPQRQTYRIKFDLANELVYYYGSDFDYHLLGPLYVSSYISAFFRFVVIVMDLSSGQYVRLNHAGQEVVIGESCAVESISDRAISYKIVIAHRNDDGVPGLNTIFVDDVILVRNVP